MIIKQDIIHLMNQLDIPQQVLQGKDVEHGENTLLQKPLSRGVRTRSQDQYQKMREVQGWLFALLYKNAVDRMVFNEHK